MPILGTSQVYDNENSNRKEQVIMVPYGPVEKKIFLVKYELKNHSLSGKVLLYQATQGQNDMEFRLVGENTLHLKKDSNQMLKVFDEQGKVFPILKYSRNSSYEVNPFVILKEYQLSEGYTASGILKALPAHFQTSCGGFLGIKVQKELEESLKKKGRKGMLSPYIQALTHLCKEKVTFKSAIGNLSKISFRLNSGNGHKIDKNDDGLTIYTDPEMENLQSMALSLLRQKIEHLH